MGEGGEIGKQYAAFGLRQLLRSGQDGRCLAGYGRRRASDQRVHPIRVGMASGPIEIQGNRAAGIAQQTAFELGSGVHKTVVEILHAVARLRRIEAAETGGKGY